MVLLQIQDELNQDVHLSSQVLADVDPVLNVAVHFLCHLDDRDEMLDVDRHLKMDCFRCVVVLV